MSDCIISIIGLQINHVMNNDQQVQTGWKYYVSGVLTVGSVSQLHQFLTHFTQQSLFTGLGELLLHTWKKKEYKVFCGSREIISQIASSGVAQWLSCIVGNMGFSF